MSVPRVEEREVLANLDTIEKHGYKLIGFQPESQVSKNLIAYGKDLSENKVVLKFSHNKPYLQAEKDIMDTFSSPNIMKALNIIHLPSFSVLVFPLAEGGDLYEAFFNQKIYAYQIQHIMKSLLTALADIHRSGYIHRDVKLDNVLILGKTLDSGIVLSDLESLTPLDKTDDYYGTDIYLSPEVIEQKGYNTSYDIWSAGTIMYILCFEDLPLNNVKSNGKINFNLKPKFERVPIRAKRLMDQLLRIDPNERISAEQALNHPYFNLNLKPVPPLKRDVSTATSRLAGLIDAPAQYEHNDIENYTNQDTNKNEKDEEEEEEEENNDNDN